MSNPDSYEHWELRRKCWVLERSAAILILSFAAAYAKVYSSECASMVLELGKSIMVPILRF